MPNENKSQKAVPLRGSRKLEADLNAAFRVHFDRVQIPLMDIPRIFKIARERVAKGQTVDDAMIAIRELYR